MTVIGVLLAAGRGSRMGCAKQLLPWKGGTVIEASFDAISPWCDEMIVIAGGESHSEITRALGDRSFTSFEGNAMTEQFASVRLGLQHARGDVVLHLADHPIVPGHVLPAILESAADRTIIPTSRGRGGHPIFIPEGLVSRILDWHGTGGLRQFWVDHPAFVHRKEFEHAEGLVIDLDTPEDYAKASQY